MLAIETKKLSKKFGEDLAVDRVDLSIKENLITGLVGPNGSGKSTIMRMLCGILKPSQGKIEINNLDLDKNLLAVQRMLGYLPQQRALFPELSIYENMYYFGSIYGVLNRKILKERISDLLKRLELEEEKNKKIEKLSGGFKQRVNIVCSLLHKPDILILDEPTIGLDPAIRIGFWNLFRELKKQGKTILISTHYMDEADDCDEVVVLKKGRIVAMGPPDVLRKDVLGDVYGGVKPKAKIRFEEVYLKLTK
jgi:ABC-2 type transport system ATP-binding protein